jgi:hypothetical protein
MKRLKPETAPLIGLDFWEARGFDEPNVLVASVRIVDGKLVWTKGRKLGSPFLESMQTFANRDAATADFLEEVWLRNHRNPYSWSVKVH